MHDEARRELARVRDEGLERFRYTLWLASLTYLADAARATDDIATAALVYPELLPLGGAAVMIGHGVACYGAADRYLGMLAATLGEFDKAEAHFEDALEMNDRIGARPWLTHTKAQYALLLRRRGRRGDGERAEALANEAWEVATELDMALLKRRLQPKIH
jgi:tetratricopeptide (TPR) repeat protein